MRNRPSSLRRCIAALCLVGLVLWGEIVHAAGHPVVEAWLRGQTNVTSWSAEFVQTRRLPALTQPLRSSGRVWFEAPDRFRWELGDPVQSVAVRHGDTLLILSPRLHRAEQLSLADAAKGPMRDALALLDTGFPRDAAEFNHRFEVRSVRESDGLHEVQLQPRDPGARRLMTGLGVVLTTNDFSLAATELRFADGTILRNDFTNAVRNPVIPSERFDTVIPAGFRTNAPTGR